MFVIAIEITDISEEHYVWTLVSYFIEHVA